MTEPRRCDRALSDRVELVRLMRQSPYMHLALADGAQPYLLPLNFGLEEQEGQLLVYFHGAPEGRKAALIGDGARCSLSFVPAYRLVKGGEACAWTAHYASVYAEGVVRPIRDEAERLRALACLMGQLGYEGEPQFAGAVLRRTAVYCIEVDHLAGKRHGEAPAT